MGCGGICLLIVFSESPTLAGSPQWPPVADLSRLRGSLLVESHVGLHKVVVDSLGLGVGRLHRLPSTLNLHPLPQRPIRPLHPIVIRVRLPTPILATEFGLALTLPVGHGLRVGVELVCEDSLRLAVLGNDLLFALIPRLWVSLVLPRWNSGFHAD
jgi:hypothetical protein